MIRHAYVDRTNRSGVFTIITSEGEGYRLTREGNVIRHEEIPASKNLGERTKFERFPRSVQKRFLKALGVNPLMRMWYMYSPI